MRQASTASFRSSLFVYVFAFAPQPNAKTRKTPKNMRVDFCRPRARGAARARAIAVPGGKWASRANVARANVRSREGETRASADLARMVVSPHKHRRGILSRGVG